MKTLLTLLLLTLFQFVLVVLSAETEGEVFSPVVQTKAGKVRGHIRPVIDNKKVYFYEGIKFGEAARFSAPKPAPAWTPDVYNATRYRFVCPQPEFKLGDHLSAEAEGERFGNEDCLYLNVWTPVGAFENGSSKNLSVMVWIHGGGFLTGSIFNGHYDGRHMAESAQVVVVSVAYRLGVFGFLYGGPGTDAPGNLGLRDQVLALRWVQENIAGFGGDPAQVTIFGQSAGSMSVGALVLSPLADGLFRRAIMMSGAPNSYLGSEPAAKSLNKTLDLAEKLHCNNSENSFPKILTCLRGKTAQQLLDSTNLALLDGESFIPVYEEGDFLPTPPVVELKSGKSFHKKGIDLMFGVTSGEGSGFVVPYLPVINSDQIDLKMTRSALGLLFQIFQLPYYQEVEDFYTKGLNDSDKDSLRRAIASSFGDFHLTCPEIFFAEALSKSRPTSRLFSYRVTQQISRGCRGWMDVCHAEDNTLVFGHPVVEPRRFTAIETKLSADMVRAWTNFAKHGDPGHWESGSGSGSGNGSSSNVQWSGAFAGADHSAVQFMELNAHHYRMVEGFYQKNCDGFWKAKLFA